MRGFLPVRVSRRELFLMLTLVWGAVQWLCPLTTGAAAQTSRATETVVGLALSTGGGPGMAHIGVLHALEEAGIEIDVVGGVSMGCIVGGLYATGRYTGEELRALAHGVSGKLTAGPMALYEKHDIRKKLLGYLSPSFSGSLRKGLSGSAANANLLSELLWPELRLTRFSELPRPLVCAATDYGSDGPRLQRVLLSEGSLPDAMMASSAVPLRNKPVWINGRAYIDGGVRQSNTIEEVRELGADVVIAVDASRGLVPQLKSEDDRMGADVTIRPDVGHIPVNDFGAVDEVLQAGYDAAIDALPRILELLGGDRRRTTRTPNEIASEAVIVESCEIHWGHLGSSSWVVPKEQSVLRRLEEYLVRILDCDDKTFTKERTAALWKRVVASEYFDQFSFRFEEAPPAKLIVNAVPAAMQRIAVSAGVDGRGVRGGVALSTVSPTANQMSRLTLTAEHQLNVAVEFFRDLAPPLGLRLGLSGTLVDEATSDSYYLPPGSQFWTFSAANTLVDGNSTLFQAGIAAVIPVRGGAGFGSDAPSIAADIRLHVSHEDLPILPTRGNVTYYRYARALNQPWWVHQFKLRQAIPIGRRRELSIRYGLHLQYASWGRVITAGRFEPLPSAILAFLEPMGGVDLQPFRLNEFVGMSRFGMLGSVVQTAWLGVQFRGMGAWHTSVRANVANISEHLDGRLLPDRSVLGGGVTFYRRSTLLPLAITLAASNLGGTDFYDRSWRVFFDVSVGMRF